MIKVVYLLKNKGAIQIWIVLNENWFVGAMIVVAMCGKFMIDFSKLRMKDKTTIDAKQDNGS